MFRNYDYEFYQWMSSDDDSECADEMSKERGPVLGLDTTEGGFEVDPLQNEAPPPYDTNVGSADVRSALYGPYNPTGQIGGSNELVYTTINGVPNVTSHAPRGIGWINPTDWDNSTWDGVPIADSTKLSKLQICRFVFPTANTMRGLEQLYNSLQPFANPVQPTKGEIQNWNIAVINHFRALFGVPPIAPSRRLYYEATWATARMWRRGGVYGNYDRYGADATKGSCWGPCPNGNPHCGACFIPSNADQDFEFRNNSLLPPLPVGQQRESLAEALGGTNTNIPWSIKLARIIAIFLCSEGTTGHTGPFLRRATVGISWHDLGDGTTQARFKFGGALNKLPGEP